MTKRQKLRRLVNIKTQRYVHYANINDIVGETFHMDLSEEQRKLIKVESDAIDVLREEEWEIGNDVSDVPFY